MNDDAACGYQRHVCATAAQPSTRRIEFQASSAAQPNVRDTRAKHGERGDQSELAVGHSTGVFLALSKRRVRCV